MVKWSEDDSDGDAPLRWRDLLKATLTETVQEPAPAPRPPRFRHSTFCGVLAGLAFFGGLFMLGFLYEPMGAMMTLFDPWRLDVLPQRCGGLPSTASFSSFHLPTKKSILRGVLVEHAPCRSACHVFCCLRCRADMFCGTGLTTTLVQGSESVLPSLPLGPSGA